MPSPRVPEGSPHAGYDVTTRYLCAAAHLDADFADAAISEYLVEPTRAFPPTPGLDAAAVLRDAVAARTRRKLRDGTLLFLLGVFAWLSPTLTVLWLITAILVALSSGRAQGRVAVALALGGGALLLAVQSAGFALAPLLGLSTTPRYGYEYDSGYGSAGGGTSGTVLATVLVGVLILIVVLVDESLVTDLTRRRFRTHFEVAPHRMTGWEHSLRTLGHGWWAAGLHRVARAAAPPPGTAEAIVYRTRNPFVGAGAVWRHGTLPLPLRPADRDTSDADPDGEDVDDVPPDLPPIAPADLLDAVARTVEGLRESVALAPTGRLRNVEALEQVLVPASRLLSDPSAPAVAGLLPDLERAPASWLPRERAVALANSPEEVARLHRCFRVESWNRDLTVTCFLTASADRRTLYLEWNHCVLAPVKERYRTIDRVDDEGPGRRALLSVVLLPATAPSRLVALIRRLRPAHRRYDEVDPDLYGAGRSLRELAADAAPTEHFQLTDAELYIQVLEQTVLRGVGAFLGTQGYSVATVREVAHNSITLHRPDLRGANIGIGRTTQNNIFGNGPGRAGGPGTGSDRHGQ